MKYIDTVLEKPHTNMYTSTSPNFVCIHTHNSFLKFSNTTGIVTEAAGMILSQLGPAYHSN